MISRHWKAISKPKRSKDYIEYLQNDTFKTLNSIPGFLSAQIFKREVVKGVEFLIVTNWTNLLAIKKFTGKNYEIPVIPLEVKEMMISYDKTVVHFEANYSFKKKLLK